MKKQFLVALHALDRNQIIEESKKVLEAGAAGVLLVNNGAHVEANELFQIADAVKGLFPDFLIGVNPLLGARQSIRLAQKYDPDALWVEDGGIVEENGSVYLDPQIAENLKDLKSLYYGGFAFKYQKEVKDLERVAKLAAESFFVPVTSGEATGKAASIDKIIKIKAAIGGHPLGLASGVSNENIFDYLPFVTSFIVASSLNNNGDFFRYDAKKVEELAQIIHNAS